jgi:hypothetical protein
LIPNEVPVAFVNVIPVEETVVPSMVVPPIVVANIFVPVAEVKFRLVVVACVIVPLV